MITVTRAAKAITLLFLYCFMTGCANTLLVEGDFPEPLIEPLPLNAAVHFSERFESFQYTENSQDREKWIIVLGDTQEELFETILEGMFTTLQEIETPPPWEPQDGIDIILSPRLNEFQYTLPTETKINVYEVWIQYNLQVYEPQGELIADWILTAYGKTPDGFMQSSEGALNQAIIVALRDAGANLALNFKRIPEIRAWLAEREPAIVKEDNGVLGKATANTGQ